MRPGSPTLPTLPQRKRREALWGPPFVPNLLRSLKGEWQESIRECSLITETRLKGTSLYTKGFLYKDTQEIKIVAACGCGNLKTG